jgi:uncharacterized membrane protein
MKKILKKLNKREIAARLILLVLFLLVPMLVDAQESQLRADAKKVQTTIILFLTIIATAVAVVMCGIHGVIYMVKPVSERGEEDSRKLKANIMKIIVGYALVVASGSIGTFVVTSLGGQAL